MPSFCCTWCSSFKYLIRETFVEQCSLPTHTSSCGNNKQNEGFILNFHILSSLLACVAGIGLRCCNDNIAHVFVTSKNAHNLLMSPETCCTDICSCIVTSVCRKGHNVLTHDRQQWGFPLKHTLLRQVAVMSILLNFFSCSAHVYQIPYVCILASIQFLTHSLSKLKVVIM